MTTTIMEEEFLTRRCGPEADSSNGETCCVMNGNQTSLKHPSIPPYNLLYSPLLQIDHSQQHKATNRCCCLVLSRADYKNQLDTKATPP